MFGVAILSLNDPCEPTAPNGLFNGLIWPKTGCASIAYGAMTPAKFLPLPAAPPFLASQETRRSPSSADAAVASDAPSIASGLSDRHRGRNGAGSKPVIKENYHGDHRHLQEVRQ